MSVPNVTDLPAAPGPENADHYEASDLGNSRRLVAAHGDVIRYVPEWGRWLHWDGRRWAIDITGHVHRLAKASAETILDEARGASDTTLFRWGIRSQSHSGITNAIALAATEPGVPVTSAELDADPWALNVANGTIDLRTGCLHPHNPARLITKLTEIEYHPDATCPTLDAFLDDIIPNLAVRTWLHHLTGYALTGLTTEQILVMFIGHGANGKTTLCNVLMDLLGEYATPAAPKLLMVEKHESHPTQVADLLGQRLVIAQEITQGQRLDEETVKALTGGDRLKARYMRQDFFTFTPSHKLILCANHKPTIRGTDHAIWRRLRLVPFEVTIPEYRQDKRLGERLRDELPGILRWAVHGCLAWQANGLAPPDAITQATGEYRQEMDLVAQFLADACVTNPAAKTRSTDLYATYKTWASTNGLTHPLSQKALAPRLEEHGYTREEDRTGRVWWVGVGLPATGHEQKEQPT